MISLTSFSPQLWPLFFFGGKICLPIALRSVWYFFCSKLDSKALDSVYNE